MRRVGWNRVNAKAKELTCLPSCQGESVSAPGTLSKMWGFQSNRQVNGLKLTLRLHGFDRNGSTGNVWSPVCRCCVPRSLEKTMERKTKHLFVSFLSESISNRSTRLHGIGSKLDPLRKWTHLKPLNGTVPSRLVQTQGLTVPKMVRFRMEPYLCKRSFNCFHET